MPSQSTLIAFIATANPKESTHFYRDVLGLTLVEDSPPALVFDVNGTMLRIAKVGIVTPPRTRSLAGTYRKCPNDCG